MNEIQLREAMRLAERPVALPAEFTDRIFEAMVVELETEAVPATAPVTRPAKAPRGRGWSIPWRPMIAIAAAIGIIFGVVSVLSVAKAPSALAALRDARQRFEKVPQYHARTAVATNDDASNPDFEMTWETEDWYQDASHWRTTITSSEPVPMGGPGDYRVMTPELFGAYDARANVFTARPAGEDDAIRFSNPSFFFDPSLQWWSTGEEGERGKPSDEFFEENCTVSETTFIGRAATKLTCASKPRDIELWLDDATGMLLKVEWFDITREITSLELDPEFPTGVFDAAAPEGAKKRWAGKAEPPPEYAVKLGVEIAARYALVEGDVAGLWIAEATETDLWVIPVRCTTRCDTELLRVDLRTGAVVATVPPPPERRIEDIELVDGELWVALMRDSGPWETPTPAAFVQRFDLATNQFVGDAIETGTSGSDLVYAAGALWSTGGQHRFVKVGRAESYYNGVARIDPATRAVTHVDVDGPAMRLLSVGDSLWVTTSPIDRRDPEQPLFELVEIDPKTGNVGRRVSVPGWPNAPVTDGERIYTLFGDDAQQWHIGVIDVATGTFSRTPIGTPGTQFGTVTVAGGHLWVLSDDGVVKVDTKTLQPVAIIGTGRRAAGIAVANGSVWITHAGDGSLVRIDIE